MKLRRGTAGAAVAAAGLLLLAVVYARFLEPRRLVVKTVAVSVSAPAAAQGIRIVHLTDFHLSPEVPLSFIRRACELAAAEKPDLICLTGDFITDYLRQADGYADALRILSAAAPTFAVAGNHDGGIWARERGGYPTTDKVADLLRSAGVVYLRNEATEMSKGGRRLVVAGLGDVWAGDSRPEAIAGALAGGDASLRILLAHNPDVKGSVADLRWDLLLAGHTHGGQLILPLLGAPFAPVRDKSMIKGLFDWQGRKIHVSPGVGNLHGIRIFSPPEVSVLEIRPNPGS